MARRQKARPQCLCPHSRGVRGEAEDTDRGDEGRDCGSKTAESGGISAAAGAGERQEERREESEEGERPQVKRITSMCAE